MDIANMSHGMGKQERITLLATNCDGLFVVRQRRAAMVEVTLDLAQTLERSNQFTSCA
jgi:hypothetical protein